MLATKRAVLMKDWERITSRSKKVGNVLGIKNKSIARWFLIPFPIL